MKHLIAVLAIAAIPRLINLGTEKFWYDEAFTAWQAQPTTDFWQAVKADNHPPLWPIIQAANVRLFGNGEFSFRLPAATLGIGIVALLFLIALHLFDLKVAVLTSILAAVSPGLIYFSQDARMYALLTFCVFLALYGALRGNWVLLAIGGIGAIYSHNLGLVFMACIWLALLLTGKIRGALVVAGVSLLWLPWLGTVLHQMQSVQASFWLQEKLDLGTILQPWIMNTLGFRAPKELNFQLGIVALGATAIGLYFMRKWFLSKQGLLVLSVAIVAPIAIALISISWRNIFVFRGLLPSTSLSFVFWAYTLSRANPLNWKLAGASLALVYGIGLYGHYNPVASSGRHDLAAWVQPIRDDYKPTDIVFHIVPNSMIDYGFYLRDLHQAVWQSPGDIVSVSDGCQDGFGWKRVDFESLTQLGYTRVWVIWGGNPFTRSDRLAELDRIRRLYNPVLVRELRINQWTVDQIYRIDL